jgi:hypothetical protein
MNKPFQFLGDQNGINDAFRFIRHKLSQYQLEQKAIEKRLADFEFKKKALEADLHIVSLRFQAQEELVKALETMGKPAMQSKENLQLLTLKVRKLQYEEALRKYSVSAWVDLSIKEGVSQYAITRLGEYKKTLVDKANDLGFTVPPDNNE